MLDTPVLFIIFNRPQTTRVVFEAIRQARPRQLFIAADGPRSNKEGEEQRCNETRQIVSNIDWDCTVHTLFCENNIGCGRGVSGAISWFFDHVEQGIILEDDTVPTQSFFRLCEELLERYKNNSSIMQISGNNPLSHWKATDKSYIFSHYSSIWGWATWRRAWKLYDFNINQIDSEMERLILNSRTYTKKENRFFLDIYKKVHQIDTWDYQWHYCRWINNGIGIVPSSNLVSNIGFGADSTHTTSADGEIANTRSFDLEFPLKHNHAVIVDRQFDDLVATRWRLRRTAKDYIKHPIRVVLKRTSSLRTLLKTMKSFQGLLKKPSNISTTA